MACGLIQMLFPEISVSQSFRAETTPPLKACLQKSMRVDIFSLDLIFLEEEISLRSQRPVAVVFQCVCQAYRSIMSANDQQLCRPWIQFLLEAVQ